MSSAPVRIVIVEDNPADVHLIREALLDRRVAFDMQHIDDGEAALCFFGKPAPAKAADIVLLDLNLPKVGGDAILRSVRANTGFAEVPVVVLTSSDSPRDRDQMEQLGATAYVRKPSNLDEFLAIGDLIQQLTGASPA